MENEQDQQKEHAPDGVTVDGIAKKYNMNPISAVDMWSELNAISLRNDPLTNAEMAIRHYWPKETAINLLIKSCEVDTNLISDGYHTFGELYEHRIELFIALCARNTDVAWKSKLHHDGSSMEGWFIMGLYQVKGFQISYHLPMSYWDRCAFVLTLDRAPEWDGHTSEDVLKRLREL